MNIYWSNLSKRFPLLCKELHKVKNVPETAVQHRLQAFYTYIFEPLESFGNMQLKFELQLSFLAGRHWPSYLPFPSFCFLWTTWSQ